MKTDRIYKKYKPAFSNESRKRKGRIINLMTGSIIIFITVLLISQMT